MNGYTGVAKILDRLTKRHKDSDWRSCEERLAAEADSLGDLLEVVKGHLSPALLDESGWRAVAAAARGWPASCGALPFGFEFQLLDRRPVVDFGLTLVPQGGTAAWIGRQESAGGFMGRLAGFLDTMGAEGARLNRLIDRVMLEVDIASASPGESGIPAYSSISARANPTRPRRPSSVRTRKPCLHP